MCLCLCLEGGADAVHEKRALEAVEHLHVRRQLHHWQRVARVEGDGLHEPEVILLEVEENERVAVKVHICRRLHLPM